MSVGDKTSGSFSTEEHQLFVLRGLARETRWMARYEKTGHRVILESVDQPVWLVRFGLIEGFAVLFFLGAALFGGMPWLAAFIMCLVSALISMVVIFMVQMMAGEAAQRHRVGTVDAALLDGIVTAAGMITEHTLTGCVVKYRADKAKAKIMDKEAVAAAEEAGGDLPDKPVIRLRSYLDRTNRMLGSEAKAALDNLLSPESLDSYRVKLLDYYLDDPDAAVALGSGVAGCDCSACTAVAAVDGYQFSESGVIVARREGRVPDAGRRGSKLMGAVNDPVTTLRRVRAARTVSSMAKKRQAEIDRMMATEADDAAEPKLNRRQRKAARAAQKARLAELEVGVSGDVEPAGTSGGDSGGPETLG